MINKIRKKYGQFSDSWINNIKILEDSKEIVISMTCSNHLNDFKYETIHLILRDIVYYNIDQIRLKKYNSVKDGFLEKKENIIILDFDPIDYFDYLKENFNSSFIIKCRQIDAVFIKEHSE